MRPVRAYLVLVAGVFSIGASAILVRYAASAPGMAVAVWRTLFAVLMLLPFAWRDTFSEMRTLPRREMGLIAGAGVVLGFHFMAFIESVYHTSVASASVLVATSALFSALFAFLFLKEKLGWKTIIAIGVAFGGAVLISRGDADNTAFPNAWFGNTLAITASMLVALYLVIGRVVRRKVSWLGYVFPLFTIAAVTILITALIRGVPLLGYEPGVYLLCAGMALFPQIIGHGSFNYGLRFFPTAWLGLVALTEPITAATAAFFLFGEIPGRMALAGMGIVMGATIFVFVNEDNP